MGKQWKQWQTSFSWAPKSLQMVIAALKLKDACSLEETMTNLDSILKSWGINHFADKGPSSQGYGFSSGHVWMWELDCEAEHRRIDAFELWCWRRLLKSPLDCKEIQAVHPKGNQSWIFNWKTYFEAEPPILWPPDAKNWLIGKDPDTGGEGNDRGWDGWMASPTRWPWVSASSGSWWWTGKPGVLQSTGSQRVRDD